MSEKYIQKFIQVDDIHTIAYREYGNSSGIPILMLHGGPGGEINRKIIPLIDLNFFHLFTIDQRGAGQSVPFGELRANTTVHLIDDIEKIRQKEQLGKCIIFGRSWGTTLGLLYALKYPQNCLYLVLRGIFLGRDSDELWTFEQSRTRFPLQWQIFSEGLSDLKPLNEQFYDKLFDANLEMALAYSAKMTHYFDILACNDVNIPSLPETQRNLIANRIFLHYSVNHYFFNDDYWERHLSSLDNLNIQGVILHGDMDNDCLVDQALYLHAHWKGSQLIIVSKASHSDDYPAIQQNIKNIFLSLQTRFK